MGERLIVLKNMKNEYNRYKSFEHCDMRNLPSAQDLARNGMFDCGEKNVTQCAFCFHHFKGWTKNDCPREVHKKGCPECPLRTIINNGNHYNPNQTSIIRSVVSAAVFLIPARSWKKRHHMNEKFMTCMGVYTKYPYACSAMILQENRLATFSDSIVMPEYQLKLAESGFYYSIQSMSIRCYMCDIGIHTFTVHAGWCLKKPGWSEFTPAELHMIGNPHCTHLVMTKGPKWHREMTQKLFDLKDVDFTSDLELSPEDDESPYNEETDSDDSSTEDESVIAQLTDIITKDNITILSQQVCL
jgi:hypothetical protein